MAPSPNVSTTPLRQWRFRQCLPFSWTILRDKHCRHPIAVMGVVDRFGQMVGHQQRREDHKTEQDHAHSQKMISFGGKYCS